MKIKITEPGWATYCGDLGMTNFENGVSVDHISQREALALGAHMAVVEVNDAGDELGAVSPGLDTVRAASISAELEVPAKRLSDLLAQKAEDAAKAAEMPAQPPHKLTREELEAIGEEKGIQGLRDIAEPLGIKSTSIRGLIAEILVRAPKA